VDLCVVAQAAHWFDHEAFAVEVNRVLKPGGLLAYVTYGIHHVSAQVDEIVGRYYVDIVGPYWPPERIHVDQHYANLPFPLPKIETPRLSIERDWTLDELLAYLATWSASKGYYKANALDPRDLVIDELAAAWGDVGSARRVTWPLTVIAGYQVG
jgi:SAM-dependent methyltransferase